MGHTKDVLSVAFSADNRQIVSAARDHTIKLWNTLGVCKYTIQVDRKIRFMINFEKFCIHMNHTVPHLFIHSGARQLFTWVAIRRGGAK